MRTCLLAITVCFLCTACGGATPDQGRDLRLRVRGAQLVRKPLPAPNGGPNVTFVDVRAPRVVPGEGGTPISGRTAAGAFAVNVATDREDAYWIVTTGVEDSAVPGELSWLALLDFSRTLEPGPFQLLVQATNSSGKGGVVSRTPYEALPLFPDGELVVSLEWDANVDADLLVVDPAGVTLGGKNINSWTPPAPGQPLAPPDAFKTGAFLDQDSNANCNIDGRRRENAVWKTIVPPGQYRVLVALTRPCGLGGTAYRLTVRRQGTSIASAVGTLFASDALGYPDEPVKAPGILAIEFNVP